MTFSLLNRFRQFRSDAVTEFYMHIEALLENEQVLQLDNFIQHYCFTRLRHSLDVAYYSFFVSRLFGWDSKSAARAGLLHDLFLYDRHAVEYDGKGHLRHHPIIALENARRICELNEVEEDIIKKHMWLITLCPPRYKEGFVVTFVDKYCALRELTISVFSRVGAGKTSLAGFKKLHTEKPAVA